MTATTPTSTPAATREARVVFPFRISPAGRDAVIADAKDEGVTASEWIRRAISERHATQARQRPGANRRK